ncbi:hypothetical protein H9P43_004480 [Blastocladiella emersonii ATCC 22665]|nr:hypothetical protein H9P43_004480 [Blastocladiella emersonii ATCC 22665]
MKSNGMPSAASAAQAAAGTAPVAPQGGQSPLIGASTTADAAAESQIGVDPENVLEDGPEPPEVPAADVWRGTFAARSTESAAKHKRFLVMKAADLLNNFDHATRGKE